MDNAAEIGGDGGHEARAGFVEEVAAGIGGGVVDQQGDGAERGKGLFHRPRVAHIADMGAEAGACEGGGFGEAVGASPQPGDAQAAPA